VAEQERGIHPRPFDQELEVTRKIFHLCGAVEPLERTGKVGGKTRVVDIEAADDAPHVALGHLHEHVQPVHHFHVSIAAHLAEQRCVLDALIGKGVELAESRFAANFCHGAPRGQSAWASGV
jgi:hypothetical protein